MKVKELLDQLDVYVLDYDIQYSECDLSKGLRFFLPPVDIDAAGLVFAGTMYEWNYLCTRNLVKKNATYLICRSSGESRILPNNNFKANEILLNTSLSLLPQIISKINLSEDQSLLSNNEIYLKFWKDILSSTITTQGQVMSRLSEFPFPMKRHLAVIVLKEMVSFSSLEKIELPKALHNFFPETNLFSYEKEWIVLYSQDNDTSDKLNFSYDALSRLLKEYHLACGISYVCQLPEAMRTLYLTASNSIYIGQQLNIVTSFPNIYSYHELNPYYLIHLASKGFIDAHKTNNLIYLAHPDIVRIYFYDLSKNTNLLDILFTYLSCGQNIGQTASKLYMHRNTVLNKLNKIEAIVQHKLDYEHDSLLILLSCMVLKYQHGFIQKRVEDYFGNHDFT